MLEENERMEGYVEAERELYRDSVKEDGFYGTFLEYLYEREDNVERWERPMIREIIRYEEELNEQHKEQTEEQSEEISETPSKLQQLASTKKELEQIVSELRENISSAQKLLDSYEKLLNEEKQKNGRGVACCFLIFVALLHITRF